MGKRDVAVRLVNSAGLLLLHGMPPGYRRSIDYAWRNRAAQVRLKRQPKGFV